MPMQEHIAMCNFQLDSSNEMIRGIKAQNNIERSFKFEWAKGIV